MIPGEKSHQGEGKARRKKTMEMGYGKTERGGGGGHELGTRGGGGTLRNERLWELLSKSAR